MALKGPLCCRITISDPERSGTDGHDSNDKYERLRN